MKKHLLGVLSRRRPCKGLRRRVPPEFLQHAISPAYGANFLGIHLAPTCKSSYCKNIINKGNTTVSDTQIKKFVWFVVKIYIEQKPYA